MEKNLTLSEKARQYAFLLLKYRLRSESELRFRLKRKNFSPGIIDSTIEFLKGKAFLDDEVFAKAWISSRLQKPFGFRRLRQELKLKGVGNKVIEAQIQQAKKDFPEEEIILSLAKEKLKKYKGVEPQKARQRVYGFLVRRGFCVEKIIEAMEQL
ncbi:MAG: regulatory protein RecX [Candidatus Omnitrophica bacterium]|nr:regulatory protein RecX [Candidatus Omnitrophota bacterium]MDD5652955.1 regulatory protein RecX [Candidatus Omnitrophota bacterium]